MSLTQQSEAPRHFRTIRRGGVGFRLVIALLAVFGLFSVSTAVVVYALSEQYWGFKGLAEKHFDRAMAVAELYRDAELLATDVFEGMLGITRSTAENQDGTEALIQIFANVRAKLGGGTGEQAKALDEILGLAARGLRSVAILPLGYREEGKDWLENLQKVRRPREQFIVDMA